jgi:hypothetical protein
MHPKKFAGFGGAILLLVGLFAFVPGLSTYEFEKLPPLRIEASYGYFLNLLAMNVVNKLALMGLGIAGILSARAVYGSIVKSINYSRAICFLTGILAIMGLFPSTNSFFGLAPLWGNQVWFYTIVAVCGGYCGYIWPKNHPEQVIDTDVNRIKPAA